MQGVLTQLPSEKIRFRMPISGPSKIQGVSEENLLQRWNQIVWIDAIRKHYGDDAMAYAIVNKACGSHLGHYNSSLIEMDLHTVPPLCLSEDVTKKLISFLRQKINFTKALNDNDRCSSLSEWDKENLLQPFVQEAIIQTIQQADEQGQKNFLKKEECVDIMTHAAKHKIQLLQLNDTQYGSFFNDTPFAWVIQKIQHSPKWIETAKQSFLRAEHGCRGFIRQAGPLFDFQYHPKWTAQIVEAITTEPEIALLWAAILFESKCYNHGQPLSIPYAKLLHSLAPDVAHTWLTTNGDACIAKLLNLHFPHIQEETISSLKKTYCCVLEQNDQNHVDFKTLLILMQQICNRAASELDFTTPSLLHQGDSSEETSLSAS